MAIVAIAFIGSFWFALSRSPSEPSSPSSQIAAPALATAAAADVAINERDLETPPSNALSQESGFPCETPEVTDGDTLRCGPLRVRLASIDAPEMPGHCRRGRTCVNGDPHASKAHLEQLIAGGSVDCRQTDTDRYGRIVALCQSKGRDLSCAQVQAGHAVIRYGQLACRPS